MKIFDTEYWRSEGLEHCSIPARRGAISSSSLPLDCSLTRCSRWAGTRLGAKHPFALYEAAFIQCGCFQFTAIHCIYCINTFSILLESEAERIAHIWKQHFTVTPNLPVSNHTDPPAVGTLRLSQFGASFHFLQLPLTLSLHRMYRMNTLHFVLLFLS